MIKSKLSKRTLTIITVISLLVISALIFTVNAWLVKNSNVVGIDKDETFASAKAAYIDVSDVSASSLKKGIPGEDDTTLNVTLTVNENSNRAFVYCIELDNTKLNENGQFIGYNEVINDSRILGTMRIASESGKIYGIWNPTDSKIINVTALLDILYYGTEVIDSDVVGTAYDGNVTQGYTFDVANLLKITYCQATQQACIDVFGLSPAEFISLTTNTIIEP